MFRGSISNIEGSNKYKLRWFMITSLSSYFSSSFINSLNLAVSIFSNDSKSHYTLLASSYSQSHDITMSVALMTAIWNSPVSNFTWVATSYKYKIESVPSCLFKVTLNTSVIYLLILSCFYLIGSRGALSYDFYCFIV